MTESDHENDLTDEQLLEQLTIAISKFLNLSKEINPSQLEIAGNQKIAEFGGLWRGSDIQVVQSEVGDDYEKWCDKIIRHGWGFDEPCPTKFPEVLTGLIHTMQDPSDYIFLLNRYQWYGNIAESAQQIEKSNPNNSVTEFCRHILFQQVGLLNTWRNSVREEMENPQPNLLEQGWRYYFAFGRNVNQTAMLSDRRCPNAHLLGPALLHDYRFLIDAKGYASVVPNKGTSVPGILWCVSPDDFKRLDKREGLNMRPPSYRKETKSVQFMLPFRITRDGNNSIDADIYVSNRPEGHQASPGYIEEILEGFGLVGTQANNYHDYNAHITPKQEEKASIKPKYQNFDNAKTTFLPDDLNLPFFAYGLFKSGQPGHSKIKKYVKRIWENTAPLPMFLERDGIPLLIQRGIVSEEIVGPYDHIFYVSGEVLYFKKGMSLDAYMAIAAVEPKKQYVWDTLLVGGVEANALMARSPERGTTVLDVHSWDVNKDDPFVGGVERFVENAINLYEQEYDFIALQAAYLMLWTAIERLAALKFYLGKRDGQVETLIEQSIAHDDAIAKALKKSEHPASFRPIFRSDDPREKCTFDPQNTVKSIKYLRQIRHNVVHRGKAGMVDGQMTLDAVNLVSNLFRVFRNS